jgi:hypothetical protein
MMRLRSLVGALCAGFISVAMLTGTAGGTTTPTTTVTQAPAQLNGEGAWSIYEMTRDWHNQLATAKTPFSLSYTAVGSHFGRLDFLNKGADWVLSGVPFTDQELASAKAKRSDFIDAPLVVASLGMLFQRPLGGPQNGFQSFETFCDPFDPTTWPSTILDQTQAMKDCFAWKPYTGAIKVPWANLAAMLLTYSKDANGGTSGEAMNSWNEPGVLNAMGVDNLASVPPGIFPTAVLRSDPDETMRYLQEFAARFAPNVWAGLKADNPGGVWDPNSESMGRSPFSSRGQADQQADQLQFPETEPRTHGQPVGGVLAPIPASLIVEPRQTWEVTHAPPDFVEFIPVQNGNGDWVMPTSEAMTKAAAAGLDTPLYAFDHKVPGAYPFTWIDHLYAPAHGLTVDKTNALATLIRYIATAGQNVAANVGEGRLPEPLVKQSLAAADSLVQSNCVGSDRKIVTSTDPGTDAPTQPALNGIGSMLLCEPVAAATTTTAPPTTIALTPTTTASVGPLNGNSNSSDSGTQLPVASETPATSSDNASLKNKPPVTIYEKAQHHNTLLVASGLPVQPSQTNNYDRLGAFLLGAVLFLFLRKPIAAGWHKVRS